MWYVAAAIFTECCHVVEMEFSADINIVDVVPVSQKEINFIPFTAM